MAAPIDVRVGGQNVVLHVAAARLDYATLVTNLDFFEHTVGVFFNISAALPVQPLVESELLIGGYEDFGFGEHITLLGLVLYGKGGGATGHTLAQRRIQCARLLLQRGADGSAVRTVDILKLSII